MTDAAIIDAYEHAYNTAQRFGSDGRDNEMPPMRDRQTMARRVRGYVTQSKSGSYTSASAPGRATSAERKALAKTGRKGGQKPQNAGKTIPKAITPRHKGKQSQPRISDVPVKELALAVACWRCTPRRLLTREKYLLRVRSQRRSV